jgi:uncharacterized membrane protein YcaP (DUF421 family)
MQIVLRAAVLYFFILVVIRAMGRKELSEISTIELLLLVVMGDLIQQGVTGDDRSVTGAMLAVATMALLVLAIGYLGFRFARVRSMTRGTPVLIVHEGRPLLDVLKLERLTMEELKEAAREQGIADIADVRMGVLEPDGKFSFLKAEESQPRKEQGRRST